MSKTRFDVKMILEVDEEDNLLPVIPEMYEDAITDLIRDMIYDIDAAKLLKIEVRQR
jgi:hypothetical protein